MASVRFNPDPPTVIEYAKKQAPAATLDRSTRGETWPNKLRQALPNPLRRASTAPSLAPVVEQNESSPPSSPLAPDAVSKPFLQPLDEPRGQALMTLPTVQAPKARLRPPPMVSATAITRWESYALRFEVLRQVLLTFQGGVKSSISSLIDGVFAQDAQVEPRTHVKALRWTGLLETPSSLDHDGTLFLMFRAALFVAEVMPSWCDHSQLAHGRELLAKFMGALRITAESNARANRASERHALEEAETNMQEFLNLSVGLEVPCGPVSCPSRSLANEFVFGLFTFNLADFKGAVRVKILEECHADILEVGIHDFLTALQYQRTAANAVLCSGLAGWSRLRPLLKELVSYDHRLAGDDERIACIPASLLSMLHIEKFLLDHRNEPTKKEAVALLCECVEKIRQLMPDGFPLPLSVELSHTLAVSSQTHTAQWLREGYTFAAPEIASSTNSDVHPAHHAREQSMRLLLEGMRHAIHKRSTDDALFSLFKYDKELAKTFLSLEEEITKKGFGDILPYVDALGQLDEWTPSAVLLALHAVSNCPQAPSLIDFSRCAMAVMDAAVGEHPLEDQEDSIPLALSARSFAPERNTHLRSLYAAAGLQSLLCMQGLGLSESHAGNITMLRAFFSPRASNGFSLSVVDLSGRIHQAAQFGRDLASSPDGKSLAYLALGAAQKGDQVCESTLSFLVDVLAHSDEKGRRALYDLIREDTRWCRPSRQESVRARVQRGRSFEKSKQTGRNKQRPSFSPDAAMPLARPIVALRMPPPPDRLARKMARGLKQQGVELPPFLVPFAADIFATSPSMPEAHVNPQQP